MVFCRPRDQHTDMIQAKGRPGWQRGWQAVGYGRRSHAQTAMFRYKALIDNRLRAQTLPAQKTKTRRPGPEDQTKVDCSVLNQLS